MLPRKNRIPTSYFSRKIRGKTLDSALMKVVIALDPNLKEPRFAVIVSQKLAKTAVLRNSLRRKIYTLLQGFITCSPMGYIIITPKQAEVDLEMMRADLAQLLCSGK